MSPLPRLLAAAAVALFSTACSSTDDGTTTAPAPEPTTEAPTAEAPTAEAPTAEAPTAEAPTAEAPTSPGPPSPAAATPSAGVAAAPAPAPTITIAGFDDAVPASVPPGTPVQATNRDREAHTVTVRGGGPAVVVPGGATVTLTAPAQPGSYEIVCDFHGDMTARLVVS